MDPRRQLNELIQQRAAALTNAEAALEAGNQAEHDAAMQRVRNMNSEIETLRNLIAEQDRQFTPVPTGAEARDMMEERGNDLRNGREVKFTAQEVRRFINQTTIATGTIVQPTGAGSEIRDAVGMMASSIVDQVYVQNLEGMGGFLEPYVIAPGDAKTGKVTATTGTARVASTSPTLGVAKLSPYEMSVTDYVDRNISRLSPANYFQKIENLSMLAMRRTLAGLIANGDGQASPDFFGIKNAKNVAGANISSSVNVTKVDDALLETLFFSYGSDEAIGQNARLYLTKADLAAIGKVRDSKGDRVYEIEIEGNNPNIGIIKVGGLAVPYTILSALTSLSASTAGSNAIQTLLYGDPMNYELALFGDFTVRVDESIKGTERMLTILGDAMVGGNVIRHNGFVVATLPKA